jgi:hypothetical protein
MMEDIKRAFEQAFKGKNGELVFKYLFAQCHQHMLNFQGNMELLTYEAGKYAIFCDILAMANIPLDQYLKKMSVSNFGENEWKERARPTLDQYLNHMRQPQVDQR